MALPLRDDTPSRRVPWATYALIVVNLVVFLFLQPSVFQRQSGDDSAAASHSESMFVERWGVVPCEVSHLRSAEHGLQCGRNHMGPTDEHKNVALSVVTAMFLHGGLLHLLGNLLFLWVFGDAVEERLGSSGFLGLYLLGGIVANLGFVAFNIHGTDPAIGASGAIAVVMGAYLVFRPRGRILSFVYTASLQVVYLPAFVVLGLFFVQQFFTPDSDHVAWTAHATGMVFGVLVALALNRFLPDHTPPRPAAVSAF